MTQRAWDNALTTEKKAAFTAACERFIVDVLKPRFLPEIKPTTLNDPVGILGRWRGSKYSFITRYRSGFADNAREEFDEPFARLDHAEAHPAEVRFDVMWRRHTGQWWRLHADVPFEDAPRLIETDGRSRPP
ncbi:MAG: hypothetical protein IPK81_01635 [Rhodospirillales bacterium]|nr:MAG: hypothetical protein IPK81_01635 [Rhodospirillales bacterium]